MLGHILVVPLYSRGNFRRLLLVDLTIRSRCRVVISQSEFIRPFLVTIMSWYYCNATVKDASCHPESAEARNNVASIKVKPV